MPKDGLLCDLLVFDLDGTLVDSQQDLVYSVNATLASLHRPGLEPHLVASFIGDGAGMLVQRALEATGGADETLTARAMPAFLAFYRAHMLDNTQVYPGVLEALGQLRALVPALPMAVLTNKPVNPSRAICDALGLSAFFFQNYGGNSFATKKPDPLGMNTLVSEASARSPATRSRGNGPCLSVTRMWMWKRLAPRVFVAWAAPMDWTRVG